MQILNRQQLALFLPNFEAIKAFEQLFQSVAQTLPSGLDDVQTSADTAQQQAGEALATLAVIAEQLSLMLLAPLKEQAQQDDNYFVNKDEVKTDSYLNSSEVVKEDFYIPPNSNGTLAEQNADNVKIKGGSIDNTPIGVTTKASGAFTSVLATDVATVSNSASAKATAGTVNVAIFQSSDATDKLDLRINLTGSPTAGSRQGVIQVTEQNVGFRALALNPSGGQVVVGSGGLATVGGAQVITTTSALANGSGAGLGTLANAPAAGNPTKWIGINDNGTIRYVPSW